MFKAIATWRSRRQAIRQLSTLSDRELDDIGVLRADIETLVWGGPRAQRAETDGQPARVRVASEAASGRSFAHQVLPSRA